MNTISRCLVATASFGVLAFGFGYFDADLTDGRRWWGGGMIVAGLAIAWPALRRLAEDWPRLKPKHDVDLAFAQIGLAGLVLLVACVLGGRAGAVLIPLVEPTPKLVLSTGANATAPAEPANSSGASRPARR